MLDPHVGWAAVAAWHKGTEEGGHRVGVGSSSNGPDRMLGLAKMIGLGLWAYV